MQQTQSTKIKNFKSTENHQEGNKVLGLDLQTIENQEPKVTQRLSSRSSKKKKEWRKKCETHSSHVHGRRMPRSRSRRNVQALSS